jgi:hypothetical protein
LTLTKATFCAAADAFTSLCLFVHLLPAIKHLAIINSHQQIDHATQVLRRESLSRVSAQPLAARRFLRTLWSPSRLRLHSSIFQAVNKAVTNFFIVASARGNASPNLCLLLSAPTGQQGGLGFRQLDCLAGSLATICQKQSWHLAPGASLLRELARQRHFVARLNLSEAK